MLSRSAECALGIHEFNLDLVRSPGPDHHLRCQCGAAQVLIKPSPPYDHGRISFTVRDQDEAVDRDFANVWPLAEVPNL